MMRLALEVLGAITVLVILPALVLFGGAAFGIPV